MCKICKPLWGAEEPIGARGKRDGGEVGAWFCKSQERGIASGHACTSLYVADPNFGKVRIDCIGKSQYNQCTS